MIFIQIIFKIFKGKLTKNIKIVKKLFNKKGHSLLDSCDSTTKKREKTTKERAIAKIRITTSYAIFIFSQSPFPPLLHAVSPMDQNSFAGYSPASTNAWILSTTP